MTRFARARGSKASNEKAPEDGTPWEVMKEQLLKAKKESEDSKNRQEAEKQRIENYENFLKDQRLQKRPATWCDFPEDNPQKRNERNSVSGPPKKKKKKSKNLELTAINSHEINHDNIKTNKKGSKKIKDFESKDISEINADNVIDFASEKVKEKESKKKFAGGVKISNDVEANDHSTEQLKKKKKKKKSQTIESVGPNESSNNLQTEPQQSHKKKKNKKQKPISSTADTTPSSNDCSNLVQEKESDLKKQNKNKGAKSNESVIDSSKQNINKQNKDRSKKKKKLIDGNPVRRKEINDRSFPIIINGKEVELVRFDGFPIMKRDAERLTELKNNMMKRGIPKSEVQRTMKLERRRAEKALARVKRDVCYNCRKGGHNLSDCPELKSKIPGADGVCFKCGSTEHRQFECKVQRSSDKEFRFASCFICKEQGHIARQCPDNPKGLYPNGGSCKLCGDVTHLRKDCPTVFDKKEETSVKLQTLESSENLEDIEVKTKSATYIDSIKKPKKIRF